MCVGHQNQKKCIVIDTVFSSLFLLTGSLGTETETDETKNIIILKYIKARWMGKWMG